MQESYFQPRMLHVAKLFMGSKNGTKTSMDYLKKLVFFLTPENYLGRIALPKQGDKPTEQQGVAFRK